MNLHQILARLNASRVRATYGAVAGVLGVPARGLGRHLGPRRPLASWVVSRRTLRPSGYGCGEIHPELTRSDRVICSPAELSRFLAC
jgi:alkylated DNA nucleotide flippase Atl1